MARFVVEHGADAVKVGIGPGRGCRTRLETAAGVPQPQAVLHGLYDAEGDEEAEQALDTPPEGQEMQVPYRGSVVPVLNRIRGHLRSSVSYAGEQSLAATREKVANDPLAYLIPLGAPARRESYER